MSITVKETPGGFVDQPYIVSDGEKIALLEKRIEDLEKKVDNLIQSNIDQEQRTDKQ